MPGTLMRLFAAGALCLFTGASMAGSKAAPKISFETDVRPILKTHCFHCHGEGEKLKGDVDLRLRRLIAGKTTDDGVVLVPGKPKESLLVKLIKSGEMPKGEKKVDPKDIAKIEAWVAA